MFLGLRFFLIIVVTIFLFACSGSDNDEESSVVDETTEKIATKAVQSIKTPIDKAEIAKGLTDQHNQAVKEQSE